jgi:hypothetical protein
MPEIYSYGWMSFWGQVKPKITPVSDGRIFGFWVTNLTVIIALYISFRCVDAMLRAPSQYASSFSRGTIVVLGLLFSLTGVLTRDTVLSPTGQGTIVPHLSLEVVK